MTNELLVSLEQLEEENKELKQDLKKLLEALIFMDNLYEETRESKSGFTAFMNLVNSKEKRKEVKELIKKETLK